jgi:hypothetical protein
MKGITYGTTEESVRASEIGPRRIGQRRYGEHAKGSRRSPRQKEEPLSEEVGVVVSGVE